MISRFCIERPIFACVVAIFILIMGFAALPQLPIAQYPEIAPPVVTVTAVYPGASADVLEQSVASPIEDALNGVEQLVSMASNSTSSGVMTLNLTFEIGSDADQAAVNVNNRVKQVEATLPEEVRRQGVVVEKGSSSFLQVIAFYSPDDSKNDIEMSNYVRLNVLDKLKRIQGTTNVQIFGAKDYAMRIWLRPDLMAAMNVSVPEIVAAIREQNTQFAAGKIGATPLKSTKQDLVYTVTSSDRLSTPEEFENIIVRANADASLVKLGDVARIAIGAKDTDFIGEFNGQTATLVGVFLQPGANALEVADAVKNQLKASAEAFPKGIKYAIPYDTTRFIEVSIHEVIKTLVEAMILVFLVVFIFLQNWRATIIPCLAVPVSLVGTFAGMYLLGYSINTLTLFGLVLSIGIVVDDAIVVLENVERIMREQGKHAKEAAVQAMEEVTGPVIAIVLVLCAAYIPVAFIGGLAGELYRQFAITLSIAVIWSCVVALVLTPTLCVLILKPHAPAQGWFFRTFNIAFDHFTRGYLAGVKGLLKHGVIALVLFAGMLGLTYKLFMDIPSSLVPDEDQGYFIAVVVLPDGATLHRTHKVVEEVVDIIESNPANKDVIAFAGLDFIGNGYKNNVATMFVTQKPWDERQMTSKELVGEFWMKTAAIKEAMVLAFNPPAIMGLGSTGGFEVYIQDSKRQGYEELQKAMEAFQGASFQSPKLGPVFSSWRPNTPQLRLSIDYTQAKTMGIPLEAVFQTLGATLGKYYVNDFSSKGRLWQVLLSADEEFRLSPDDIGRIPVPNGDGQMVSLATFAEVEFSSGPDTLERYNNLLSVKLIGEAQEGVSSGEALAEVTRLGKSLPDGFDLAWSGASLQEVESSGTAAFAFIAAIIMVFLILAALYGKWSLPFSVILALPFGTFGAFAALYISGLSNDVYFQIGLVTLLGLAARNGILIVEYAVLLVQDGMDAGQAAMEAARLRFRPILMTSLAFILGVIPLVTSSGAGAGARQSVGTGVMGGMLAATFLAVFFVPIFFYWLSAWRLSVKQNSLDSDPQGDNHKSKTTND